MNLFSKAAEYKPISPVEPTDMANAHEPGDLLTYRSGIITYWESFSQIVLRPGEHVMITGERRHYFGEIYFVQAETEDGRLIDISSDLIRPGGHFESEAG